MCDGAGRRGIGLERRRSEWSRASQWLPLEAGEALARWQGKEGGLLECLSREDGRLLQAHKLTAPPVFDGMAAAYGKLYLCLADGSVVCFSDAE